MRRKTLLLATVLAIVLAAPASAQTAWVNSVANVERNLLDNFATPDGEPFVDMTCHGVASQYYGRHHGQRDYHEFRCNGFDDLDRHIWLRVIVTGQSTRAMAVQESGCNASMSAYACPAWRHSVRLGSGTGVAWGEH